MFNLNNFPNVILHIKTISSLFKLLSNNNYYQAFCPFCNDATRKNNPSHGHLNICVNSPFVKCFRCDYKNSLFKFLIDTGYNNKQDLVNLKNYSSNNYTYLNTFNIKYDNKNLIDNLENIHHNFMKNYNKEYKTIKDYLYNRCLNINMIDFLLYPSIVYDTPSICFQNNAGEKITCRLINNKKYRYKIIGNNKSYYFFQDINDIMNYNNIFIAEGPFDIINAYNYSPFFNNHNTFYISINGSSYYQSVKNLISKFLMIGNFNIHILFDSNVNNKLKNINQINFLIKNINFEINSFYYTTNYSKDISEFINLSKIKLSQ